MMPLDRPRKFILASTLSAACLYPFENTEACQLVNEGARHDFNFTSEVSRWGDSKKSRETGETHRINSITINKLPIFDLKNPREDYLVYRWANKVHVTTLDQVIRHELLFDEGQKVTHQQLDESERLLRDRNFSADARVRVLTDCDGDLDVEVVTREVWTLSPEFSYKSSGGDSKLKLGIRDTNFFGTGRQVAASFASDVDRDSYKLSFQDANLAGTRHLFKVGVTSSSDGHEYELNTGLPFYALDSRRSWTLAFKSTDSIRGQYLLGEKVSELRDQSTLTELSYGISGGLQNGATRRWTTGLMVEKSSYSGTRELPLPEVNFTKRSATYPFLGYEYIEDNYARAYNINQIYRTEDLHVGRRIQSTIGSDFGSDPNLFLKGAYSDTLLFQPKALLQLVSEWEARWNDETRSWENGLLDTTLSYHRGQTANRSLYVGLSSVLGHNLDPGSQVSLGGETGLRGFRNHAFNGDSSLVFTIEERLFTEAHILNLARVGYAVFFDAGRMIGPADDNAIHANVGLGLRLAPSKSEKGQVIHLDLAYPVTNSGASGGLQFVAELKRTF